MGIFIIFTECFFNKKNKIDREEKTMGITTLKKVLS